MLAANTTTKIFVSQESDLEDVLRMVRKVAKPGVPEHFGSCEYSEVITYRLEPPPNVRAFKRSTVSGAMENVEEVLAAVQRIALDDMATMAEVFDVQPDRRSVCLYIEKHLGETPISPQSSCTDVHGRHRDSD